MRALTFALSLLALSLFVGVALAGGGPSGGAIIHAVAKPSISEGGCIYEGGEGGEGGHGGCAATPRSVGPHLKPIQSFAVPRAYSSYVLLVPRF